MRYDVLNNAPRDESCSLEDLLDDKLECLDFFVIDIVQTHMNTTDLHASENDKHFHIPAFFGDDFAFTNATHNFRFIDKLSSMLA